MNLHYCRNANQHQLESRTQRRCSTKENHLSAMLNWKSLNKEKKAVCAYSFNSFGSYRVHEVDRAQVQDDGVDRTQRPEEAIRLRAGLGFGDLPVNVRVHSCLCFINQFMTHAKLHILTAKTNRNICALFMNNTSLSPTVLAFKNYTDTYSKSH